MKILLAVLGILLVGSVAAEELADRLARYEADARNYLEANSDEAAERKWKARLVERVNDAIRDRPGADTNSVLNSILLDWAVGRDFARLSDADKLTAARLLLIYRDQAYSPFRVDALALPRAVLEAIGRGP